VSTIKNGKYSDSERARLGAYDHPEYGPNLNKKVSDYSPGELKDKAANQEAGAWRYPIGPEE
jgi:hypothetical protein